MKALVTYFSQTGNTRKVAEAIYDELQGEKEIRELSEVESVEGYDLLFVGFPIQAFEPAKPAKEFLQGNCSNRKIALFITHAQPEDFDELDDWLENCKSAATGAELAGSFNCQGEMADFILEAMLKNDDPQIQKLAKGASTSIGQPDAVRLERARSFTRSVIAGQEMERNT